MKNALLAEAHRILARRSTLIAMIAIIGLLGLFQVLVVADEVSPPSAAELQQAEQDYQDELKDWTAHHKQWEAECAEDTADPGANEDVDVADCAESPPTLDDWIDQAVPFDEVANETVSLAIYLTALAAFVVGASFLGAEFSTGSLANWLTFVPRRGRVFTSKLLVVAAFSVVFGVLAVGASLAATVLITVAFGQPLPGLAASTQLAARGMLIVVALGVLGYCITALTRSTAATIGVLPVVFVATAIRDFLGLGEQLGKWSPGVNAEAVLHNGTEYGGDSFLDDGAIELHLSLAHGLGYWAALCAVLVIISWLVFRRRDVT